MPVGRIWYPVERAAKKVRTYGCSPDVPSSAHSFIHSSDGGPSRSKTALGFRETDFVHNLEEYQTLKEIFMPAPATPLL